MTAFRLTGGDPPAGFAEVEVPRPGPGEVLVKMAGVGLCGTDLHFLDAPGDYPYELPFTLGHENAGWVEDVGDGVDEFSLGEAVAASSGSFCGRCARCRRGQTNHCFRFGWFGRGFGADGGLASYLVVPRHELVTLRQVDPRTAGPLTDAAATSYHAVRRTLPKLVPGSTALVIGVGGLGGFAVQLLKALSAARIVAVDRSADRRRAATALGADEVIDGRAGREVRDLTGGEGADVVLDFVGADDTMKLAVRCAAPMGAIAFVGVGGGTVAVGQGLLPAGCEVFAPMSSTIGDLQEVIALAEAEVIRVDAEVFPFEQAPEAYRRFRAGEVSGRAVVTPNG
ncbi:MAG TPA: alcohol dehydrogenase catalytic domain-containing protein [Acidimicrobiales bacterium]|nr:alcohol dehydrogenase catalytic domain-containing protein [Acidimicrobiales bacterium]